MTEPQIKRLYAIASSHGWTHEGVKTLLAMNYKIRSTRELTDEQYDEVCDFLENSPAANTSTMRRDSNTVDLFEYHTGSASNPTRKVVGDR